MLREFLELPKLSLMRSLLMMVLTMISLSGYGQNDSSLVDQSITEIEVLVKSKKSDELQPKELQQLTDRFLSDIPQVTLIRRGNFAQEPTIRGLNAGQINLTIDGMQIFGACTDRMDPISSYIEPNNLRSIRLHTSPNSEDISGSVGGGIDFKLRTPSFSENVSWNGNIGTGIESNGWAHQTLGGINFGSKRVAFLVNGTYRKSNNYFDGDGNEIRYSQYEKWNASANLSVKLSETNKLEAVYIQDEGYNIGYPALTMDVSFAKAKIASIEHEYHAPSKKLAHWQSKLYWNFIDHAMDDTKRAPEEVPMHMDMPGTSRTIGFYSKGILHPGKGQKLQLSLNGFMNDLHAEMTMYPDMGAEMFMLTIPDTRRIQGGFNLSYKTRLSDKWMANASARSEFVRSSITTDLGRQTLTSIYFNDPDQSTITYNGSIGLRYSINSKLSSGLSAAYAMRAPRLQELYGFYLFNRADNYDYLGNPDLETERSTNVEWNLKYTQKRVTAEVRAYAYFFQNYIAGVILKDYSAMTIGASGVKHYENIGAAVMTGVEGTLRWQIIEGLELNSISSFTYGRDEVQHALPFIPPLKTMNTLTYKWKETFVNVGVTAASDQSHVSTDFYGERASKGYALLNAGLGYRLKLKESTLNFSLKGENLLNRVYYDHLDLLKINKPGRNVILRVGYTF